jgi:hypothetical protein
MEPYTLERDIKLICIPAFSKAFKELCADPRIDPQGAAVEMYYDEKDVRCMVRLDPAREFRPAASAESQR